MNERIRELIKQAGGHFSTHNLMSNPVQHRESIELWDKNIEKFAELIVKECADFVADQARYAAFNGDVHAEAKHALLGTLIKKHFGVE